MTNARQMSPGLELTEPGLSIKPTYCKHSLVCLTARRKTQKTELKRTIFVGLGRDSPVSRLWNIDSASSPRIFEQRKPKKRLLAASCLNTFSIESLTQDPVDRVHVQHYTGRNIFLGIKTILYEYFPDYCKKKKQQQHTSPVSLPSSPVYC